MAMIMEVMESLDKLKSEPPCTPTPAGKHAHSFSAEMSIRKRPGIVTRTQKKALEALGPLEDDGELEPLEKERRVPSSKMEDMSKNEGRVQKWRTGPKMEDGPRNGGRIQKSPHMPVTLFT